MTPTPIRNWMPQEFELHHYIGWHALSDPPGEHDADESARATLDQKSRRLPSLGIGSRLQICSSR
jgi:hypothetical protein